MGFQRVDRLVVQEGALRVHDRELASRAEPRVNGKHRLFTQGGRHQQFPDIAREDGDGVGVGALLEEGAGLRFHGGAQQALIAVLRRECDLARSGGAALHEAGPKQGDGFLFGGHKAYGQEAFLLAAQDREYPVGRRFRRGLGPLEVVTVLCRGVLLSFQSRGRT